MGTKTHTTPIMYNISHITIFTTTQSNNVSDFLRILLKINEGIKNTKRQTFPGLPTGVLWLITLCEFLASVITFIQVTVKATSLLP